MKIFLASKSPRRLLLLNAAGFEVEVCPTHIDETQRVEESAKQMTLRLCREKAQAFVYPDSQTPPVVAADTLVAVGDKVLGQPTDVEEAKAMIRTLSGKQHQVHTAVCVRLGDEYISELVTTSVVFREISNDEIDAYVQHNVIMDKAGAYAIQEGASSFIVGIEGYMDNVIGLPVAQTKAMIERLMQSNQGE